MRTAEQETELIGNLLRQFKELETKRAVYEPIWKEVTEKVLPRRSVWDIESDTTPVRPKLFNSHALDALKKMCFGFEGYMVSRTKAWSKLTMEKAAMNLPDVRDWLEEVESAINKELQASNFFEATSEYIADAGSVGTAVMYSEEDIENSKTYFTTRHMREMYLAENQYGQVDTIFRRFRMTNRQAFQRFGSACCEKLILDSKENPEGFIIMMHIVKPRKDRDLTSLFSTDMPWASFYVDTKNNKIVTESGYEEFPYHPWRWVKNSDEVYGRAPAMDAIADITILNQVSYTRLKHAQITVDPPFNIPFGIKGEERLLPHGANYVQKGEEVKAIQVAGNYPIAMDVEKNLEKTIDNHFNVDFFLMISQQERTMTAREVVERKGEQAAVLGAAVGRYEHEGLAPVIERTYGILSRRGALPPLPQSLANYSGKIQIEYTGFLAQIQKSYFQTSGISQGLEYLIPVSQINPAILDNIDMDSLTRTAMDGYGIPQSAIREMPAVKKLRAARQAQADAQAQAQSDLEEKKLLAGNVDGLNKEVVPGSMIENMARQA